LHVHTNNDDNNNNNNNNNNITARRKRGKKKQYLRIVYNKISIDTNAIVMSIKIIDVCRNEIVYTKFNN